MQKAKIAIITRTKNRNILLRRALESVLNQSFKNWLMVIINDGGNKEEVDQLCAQYKDSFNGRLLVIHNEESRGMEAASNRGITSCDSDFIVIHDDDDSWHPDFLKICFEKLEHCPISSVKGVVTHSVCVCERIEGDKVQIVGRSIYNGDLESVTLAKMASSNQFPPISFLYKREVFEEIGLYDESLPVLGDWDFNLRFLEKFDILVIKEPLAYYHHRVADFDSVYSNTVIGGKDKHILYDSLIRNRLIRKDIQQNRIGLGLLVNTVNSNNATDAKIVNRYKLYYKTLIQWLKLKIENKEIVTYLRKCGYRNIAIYGIGELGRLLYEEVKNSELNLKFFIDKNKINKEQRMNDVLIVNIEEIKQQPKVDAIIVTPIYDFEAIANQLREAGVNTTLVSLEELVDLINY